MAPFTYISLFSGVGALGLGLEIAVPEAECVCHVEINLPACEVLAARMEDGSLSDCPIWSDVRSFDGRPWRGRVRAIVGGFPCQDLSVAGKRAGLKGKRSGLWGEYERIVSEVKPETVLVENVGGLLSSLTLLHRSDILGYVDEVLAAAESPKERWYAQYYIDRLERRLLPIYGMPALLYVQACLGKMGYESEAGLFTAAEVGASHDRLRVFILAHRQSGGFGELRESSRCNGLADGSHEKVGNATGNDERRDSVSGIDGTRIEAGGSGGSLGHAEQPRADTQPPSSGSRDAAGKPSGQLADASRDERPGPHGEAGTRRGVCGASNTVADASNGLIQESRWGPEGRDGTGSAEQVLADADISDDDRGRQGRQGGRRQSPDERGSVGNSDLAGLEGRDERGHSAGERSRRELADSGCERDQRRRKPGELGSAGEDAEGQTQERERRWNATGDSLPLFAPGPGSTELWQRILSEHPYLAPAISQEEIESIFRRTFNGRADEFDIEDRTDRLRAIGNMVCPLQAAVAIVVLARRMNHRPASLYNLGNGT